MTLRPATPDDVGAIASLHAFAWRRAYKGTLNEKYLREAVMSEREAVWAERLASPKANQCVLVMEGQGGVAGFACVFAAAHPQWGSYLDSIFVQDACQGQGIGRALMGAAVRWCARMAPDRGLYLSVNQDNARAQDFYRQLGGRNAQSDSWDAPEGSSVPTFWFVWDSAALANWRDG